MTETTFKGLVFKKGVFKFRPETLFYSKQRENFHLEKMQKN